PHVSSGVRSAGCNLIATRVFGMSETIAITGKSVKLFKGHYTSRLRKGNPKRIFLRRSISQAVRLPGAEMLLRI
ncbi:MAG: hypothetical protein ACREYE_15415, partial [Gammaproteobacteria bacterium]